MPQENVLPKRRIRDVTEARSTFTKLLEDDEEAREARAQLRNQAEGGQPLPPGELKRLGRAYEANFNHGGARADFEKAMVPYFRMVWDMPTKASYTIHRKHPQVEQWQKSMETCFDRFVTDWGQDAIFQYLAMSQDHCGFGAGIVYFPDPDSPRWVAVNRGDVLIPRRTPANTKSIPLVALRQNLTISDLYEKIVDESAAKDAGWNVPAIKRIIAKVAEEGGSNATLPGDWERIQDSIRDNDAGMSASSDSVPVVSLLVREFTQKGSKGRVSCVMLTEQDLISGPGRQVSDEYIFEDPEFAEEIGSVLKLVVYDVPLGERNFHGLRGFLSKNYSHARIENRLLNKVLDATDMRMGLVMSAPKSVTGYPVRRLGSMLTVVDDQVEVMQNAALPDTSGAVNLWGVLQQNKSEKLSQYQQASSQVANSDTATSARLVASMQSQVNQASAALYLAQVSGIFAESDRRLSRKGNTDPDAKAWVARLIESEVPEEVIFKAEKTVLTAAAAGAAAPWSREEKYSKWNNLMGVPMVNSRWLLESQAAQDFGANAVSKVVPPEQGTDMSYQAYVADMENPIIGDGQPLHAQPIHDHRTHIGRHVQPIVGIVQRYMQTKQSDPRQTAAAALLAGHIEEHFQIWEGDKTQEKDRLALRREWSQLEGQVRNMVTSATQQPQPTQ